MQIQVSKIIENCQAKLVYAKDFSNCLVNGAVSDNREIKGGELFVCIKGSKVDGHDFAMDAVARGASAILAEHNPLGENPPVPVLLVKDSVLALQNLAKNIRQEFSEQGKVIAITGSAGKTTVKELLAHILSSNPESLLPQPELVGKNLHNYNTQLGVALAILNFTGLEKYWVLEIGISKAHDMDELGSMVEPDFALLLNVCNAHYEGLSEYGVAYYKASLLQYLAENGRGFVSYDYPDLVQEAKAYQKNLSFFSIKDKIESNEVFYRVKSLGLNTEAYGQYEIEGLGEKFVVNSPLIGTAGAENCLAATCIALNLGFSGELIAKGIQSYIKPQMRFNIIYEKDWLIINDCYNANPLSTKRMIEAAKELAKNKKFYVLLGEMKELGELSNEEHYKLGIDLAKLDIETVFWVGGHGELIQGVLKTHGFLGDFVELNNCNDFENKLNKLFSKKNLEEKLILFKGSRSNNLEEYLKKFMEWSNAV